MSVEWNLEKNKVKLAFAQAAATYDNVTQLQRIIGKDLLTRIEKDCKTATLLDLGCGTGFLTQELLALLPCKQMIALDIALPMLQAAKVKLVDFNNVHYVCADAEHLPIIDQTTDGIFSNLMLQWCVNITAVFAEIKRVLKPSGCFVFSIFGPKTLQELKQAWSVVDAYSHVNYFYSEEELVGFLRCSGFNNISIERRSYVSYYNSVWVLMRELKHIGAHNVNTDRNKQLTTKRQMQKMIATYPQGAFTGQISATFDVITIKAQA